MHNKDINGFYYLESEKDYICSQCSQAIKNEDKIFIDAVGMFLKGEGLIKIKDLCVYHYKCIISDDQ
ncbi:MAG: hypothetical protein GF383_11675 [Candidatus Lokiarchaeota archaeon]|nr:hypothetical protein [Candidatus Lokiarchaeota archaeon]MBD3341411.1 hypothetical protein [Candidatus Lokiarchaeota archaeon]